MRSITLSVTEFKARSLKLVDDISRGRLSAVTVTKRGKPLAVLSAHGLPSVGLEDLYGSMRGRSRQVSDVDLTQPIYDGPLPHDPLLAPDAPP